MRFAVALLIPLLAQPLPAQSALTIMENVQRRSLSSSFRYEGEVTVSRANGSREMKAWSYRRIGAPGQGKATIRFLEPAEIRGVALLTWQSPERPASIWLYTPATARTRRIAPQDRSSRFAGTDFTYEDLEEDDLSSWSYSDLKEASEDGEPCWLITGRRSEAEASSDRTLFWISKSKMTPVRIERWREGRAIRRLDMQSFESRQGIWTPMVVEVADLERGSLTTLRLSEADYNERMTDADFSIEALRGDW